jgi:hypothetical protein
LVVDGGAHTLAVGVMIIKSARTVNRKRGRVNDIHGRYFFVPI